MRNQTNIPLFLEDVSATIRLPDGSEQENTTASDRDMDRVFQAYPSLNYLRGESIHRDITMTPGESVQGLTVFNFPITKDQWDKLQAAKVVVSLMHHKIWNSFYPARSSALVPDPQKSLRAEQPRSRNQPGPPSLDIGCFRRNIFALTRAGRRLGRSLGCQVAYYLVLVDGVDHQLVEELVFAGVELDRLVQVLVLFLDFLIVRFHQQGVFIVLRVCLLEREADA